MNLQFDKETLLTSPLWNKALLVGACFLALGIGGGGSGYHWTVSEKQHCPAHQICLDWGDGVGQWSSCCVDRDKWFVGEPVPFSALETSRPTNDPTICESQFRHFHEPK